MLRQRREFLKSVACAAAIPMFGQNRAAIIGESDPNNAKLCHRLDANRTADEDLRFLQQIGLRWVRLEFGEGDVSVDTLRTAQQRFAGFGIRIYSGVHAS
jgi:hypothetical protein